MHEKAQYALIVLRELETNRSPLAAERNDRRVDWLETTKVS